MVVAGMKRPRELIQMDRTFDELQLHARVVEAVKRTGKYEHPTAVQATAIPLFVRCGATLAFLSGRTSPRVFLCHCVTAGATCSYAVKPGPARHWPICFPFSTVS